MSTQPKEADAELRSGIMTLFNSDTTYLIPPGTDSSEWYADHIIGMAKVWRDNTQPQPTLHCLSVDCPEHTGGECNANAAPPQCIDEEGLHHAPGNQGASKGAVTKGIDDAFRHLTLVYPDDTPGIYELHMMDVTLKGVPEAKAVLTALVAQQVEAAVQQSTKRIMDWVMANPKELQKIATSLEIRKLAKALELAAQQRGGDG